MVFGIIGYGRFGKLWANSLSSFGKVLIYDSAIKKNTSLQQIGMVDILFFTVPISQLESSCKKLKKYLNPQTLVVDCCSVKIYPAKIMKKIFGKKQPLLPTHPLFGPDSVHKNGGLKNLKIVICPQKNSRPKALLTIFKKMGLQVLIATARQHDQQMAHSQALVHFIGRGLTALNLQTQRLATPDYQALLSMNEMVNHDKWQLFLDMHRYNPYTIPIRKKILSQLLMIDQEISNN